MLQSKNGVGGEFRLFSPNEIDVISLTRFGIKQTHNSCYHISARLVH